MHKPDHTPEALDAEATYTKAAKAELSQNYDLAFRLYIKSAELFLHLSGSSNGQGKADTRWKANAGKALQRAEKIKAFVEQSKPTSISIPTTGGMSQPGSKLSLTPVGIDHFSAQEQFYILKKGGYVNGLVFPLWKESVILPQGVSTSSPYQDPDGQPKLSPEQVKASPVWRRPQVLAASHKGIPRQILPQEIIQHIVTDCSVCASISVCLEHSRRFRSGLAESAVFNLHERSPPANRATTSLGGYDIKVLFNGAWRRIVVDDKLPYHPNEGTLMCMSVLSPNDGGYFEQPNIWPSIIEKGYMKLMGGYDFPGSNSSIDLHTIVGWIPEHVEIKGPNFEREKTWERVIRGFQSGTSPGISWLGNSLLGSHSYAVIDVEEEETARTFTVLDTWVDPGHANQSREPSRVLRIPWTDVLNVFDGIYLSWNPVQWPMMLTYHGMWNRSGRGEDSSVRQVYLQFKNRNENVDEEILILLTRHVVNSSRMSDFISLKVEVEDALKSTSSVDDQTTIAAKGNYTNSTHVLIRTRIPCSQKTGILTILASYDGQATEIGFTLTAYASHNFDIAWDEHVPIPPFVKKIDGVLTSKTAGGNCTYPTFMSNPQYSLRIHAPKCSEPDTRRAARANVSLTMQTSRDIPVNISVVWSRGDRIDDLVAKDLVTSSGAYSYGLARVTKEIAPGDYTIILSAFEPHHMGPYSLKIESSRSFDVAVIPQEGAGMYSKVIRGAWTSQTAGGGPTSDRYSKNPIFEIEVLKITQLRTRLQLLRPSTATSLNVTIFPASSSGSLGRHTTTSGAYNDAISGVATPQVSLSPGKYWVVPSTYNPGVEAKFHLIVYSTVPDLRITETRGH